MIVNKELLADSNSDLGGNDCGVSNCKSRVRSHDRNSKNILVGKACVANPHTG
jgi:hypothetical protein